MTEKNYRNWQMMRADGYAAYQRKYGRRMMLSGFAGWLFVVLVSWAVSGGGYFSVGTIFVFIASASLLIASVPLVLKQIWQHYEAKFLELTQEVSVT